MNQKNSKIRILILIAGMIAAIVAAILPVFRTVLPVSINLILFKILAISICSAIILGTVGLLFSKQLIVKMVVFPFLYSISYIFYYIYKSRVYLFFLNAFSIGERFDATDANLMDSMPFIFSNMTIGIWVSLVPVIICAVFSFKKANIKIPKNIDTFISKEGKIISLEDTHMRINRKFVYTLGIEYNYDGEKINIKKDILVPMHMIHLFNLNGNIGILINPDKNDKIFIQNEYGIF